MAGQVAGQHVDRVLGQRAGRAEHGDLAHLAIRAEDPEGLGHLGQGGAGDLEVADRRALLGQVAQRPDHRLQLPGLGRPERVLLGQLLERLVQRVLLGVGQRVGQLVRARAVGLFPPAWRSAPGHGVEAVPARAYSVERCTSGRPKRGHQGLELLDAHALPVGRAGRPRDVLVHERAPDVVGAGLEDLAGALDAHLHPTHLNVVDVAVVGDAGHRVHEQRLAEGRPAAGLALQVDRRGHVDEGERHELGEATGLALQGPGAHDVAGPAVAGARPSRT